VRPAVLILITALAIGLIVAAGLLLLRAEPVVGPGPGKLEEEGRPRPAGASGVSGAGDELEPSSEPSAEELADPGADDGDLTLAGQVVDDAFRPVAGAEVHARSRRFGAQRTMVRSEEDGRFRFDGLVDGRYSVWARAPFHSSFRLDARAGSADLALVLKRAGEITVTLTGLESADGRFPFARVELLDPGGEVESWEDNEESRGPVFLFRGVAPGEYGMRAIVFGAGGGSTGPVAVRAGETTEVRIAVEEGVVLEGRVVVAGDGSPVADAFVVATDGEDLTFGLSLTNGERFALLNSGIIGRSGKDGRFRIPGLRPGRWTVAATAPGRAPTARVLDLPARKPVTIPLAPGAELIVTVLDREGAPVEGVHVMCAFPHGGENSGRTDAKGVVRFQSLPTGEMSIAVFRYGEWWINAWVKVAAGKPVARTLRVPKGPAVLTGIVTKGARPEPGVRLTLSCPGTDVHFDFEQYTGPDGRFRFDQLPAGTVHVRIPWSREKRKVELAPGENTLDLAVPSAGVRIRIVDHQTGRPVEDARVRGALYAHADEEGCVDLADLEETELNLGVHARGYAPTRIRVTPSVEKPEVVVRLRRGVVLRLKIVDASGNAVQAPEGTVVDAKGRHVGGWVSDDAPVFRLLPGTYEVAVYHPDFAPWAAKVVLGDTDETATVTLQPK